MTEVHTLAVIGPGLIGTNIALDFAAHGYPVRLCGRDASRLATALDVLDRNSRLLARPGQEAEFGKSVRARVQPFTSLRDATDDVDLVIEAVAEDLALKQQIFAQLDAACAERTILASTTSTFVQTALAGATRRPERVIVAHYFNPPHLLPLVELVVGSASDETVSTMHQLLTSIGKHPALVRKEVPGFLANRLQAALLREAYSLVDRGIATPEDIDTVIRYGFGRRLSVAGVFEIGDLAGLDLYRAAFDVIVPDIDSSTTLPSCFAERVSNGHFGAKTGAGFYDWPPGAADRTRQRIAQALIAIAAWDRAETDSANP